MGCGGSSQPPPAPASSPPAAQQTSRPADPQSPQQAALSRHSSQHLFKERNQTAIVFDFDDTLFPTTFVEKLSVSYEKGTLEGQELTDFMGKIEECQTSCETLLQTAREFGQVMIVTLSTRGLLKKRCETWYPRVWKLMGGQPILYGRESQLHKDASKKVAKQDELTMSHWAHVKGTVIQEELDRFYSQYKGQSWKNIVSIGDSDIERYGTLGASNSYVQKRFGKPQDGNAFVNIWQNFDNNDSEWKDNLEGEANGHVFKVRTKVVKMLDAPSPAQLCQQQKHLLQELAMIVGYDGCLNLMIDDLRNDQTLRRLQTQQMLTHDMDDIQIQITARVGSSSLAFTNEKPTVVAAR